MSEYDGPWVMGQPTRHAINHTCVDGHTKHFRKDDCVTCLRAELTAAREALDGMGESYFKRCKELAESKKQYKTLAACMSCYRCADMRRKLDSAESLLLRWHQEADAGEIEFVDLKLMCDTDEYVLALEGGQNERL